MAGQEGLNRLTDYCWEIPKGTMPQMRVPARIYSSSTLIQHTRKDDSLKQVVNVATLPGIVKYSLAMPDIHSGYGFPIGGVAATDIDRGGVISPGGIGYDINCGVRVIRSGLTAKEIMPRLDSLITLLYNTIPVGVGAQGSIRFTERTIKSILSKGARWAVEHGYGTKSDLDNTESGGCLTHANPDNLSKRAISRGLNQSGTLGSGNHFIEIEQVDRIYDATVARVFGIEQDQVVIMLHTGSRGLGYQVCDDFIKKMRDVPAKYGYTIPDRQLVCAPFNSPEGQEYFGAVCAAANYAWSNRQYLMWLIRGVFEKVLSLSWERLGLDLIYDVAHNIAKVEFHEVDGKKRRLCVHRKGATRAFASGNPELSEKYRPYGQPVIVPGDMGTNSYIMVGTDIAMKETFGSVCHGAGRILSRTAARKRYSASGIIDDLHRKGITIMAKGKSTIIEEASGAYKDIDQVVECVVGAGLGRKVARMRPLGVVKG